MSDIRTLDDDEMRTEWAQGGVTTDIAQRADDDDDDDTTDTDTTDSDSTDSDSTDTGDTGDDA
jgi:hypothetical protein